MPTGMPCRSAKFEIAFFARRTTGFWPLISATSATTESSSFGFFVASPRPTFSTIFCRRGTCIVALEAELLLQAAADLLLVVALHPRLAARADLVALCHGSSVRSVSPRSRSPPGRSRL
jgi:hypothetical protein